MKTVRHDESGKAWWGEEDHLTASQNKSFSEMIFETLTERSPSPEELKVFELILNISIDHGLDTPSAIPTIEAAKRGENMSDSIAEGIRKIGDSHGGAAEPLMKLILSVRNQELSIKEAVEDRIKNGERMPGFGHRIYKDKDPRAELILDRLQALGTSGQFIQIARDLESELEKQTGKHLPLNIDGAIAVAFCSMDFPPELGKAIFIIARTPGLIAHYLENRA